MVVMTAKVSRKKLLLAAVAVAAIAALVLLLRPAGAAAQNADDRAAFLASFGYTVVDAPVQTQSVRIPAEPSEVFDRYNALQKSQGYDLSALAGKTVTRYVYPLTDCGEGEWFATVLEYRGKIVGGDVANSASGGQMHGFARDS